jgi:hypothetical protein
LLSTVEPGEKVTDVLGSWDGEVYSNVMPRRLLDAYSDDKKGGDINSKNLQTAMKKVVDELFNPLIEKATGNRTEFLSQRRQELLHVIDNGDVSKMDDAVDAMDPNSKEGVAAKFELQLLLATVHKDDARKAYEKVETARGQTSSLAAMQKWLKGDGRDALISMAAFDVIFGMGDRVVRVLNGDNFMIDLKKHHPQFICIDNAKPNEGHAYQSFDTYKQWYAENCTPVVEKLTTRLQSTLNEMGLDGKTLVQREHVKEILMDVASSVRDTAQNSDMERASEILLRSEYVISRMQGQGTKIKRILKGGIQKLVRPKRDAAHEVKEKAREADIRPSEEVVEHTLGQASTTATSTTTPTPTNPQSVTSTTVPKIQSGKPPRITPWLKATSPNVPTPPPKQTSSTASTSTPTATASSTTPDSEAESSEDSENVNDQTSESSEDV